MGLVCGGYVVVVVETATTRRTEGEVGADDGKHVDSQTCTKIIKKSCAGFLGNEFVWNKPEPYT